MNRFKVIGYYICEVEDTPKWLFGISRQMLSVSSCIGSQHPRQECFMGEWLKDESRKYQKRLQMDEEQYKEFTKESKWLFKHRRIDVDCRFLQLSDARYFHGRICQAVPCHVVSIATPPEYFEILARELKGKGSNSYGQMSKEEDDSQCIGSDILGWDIGGFHSFLCNSLQKGLPDAKFNDMGLLDNEFHEVAGFACQIEGKGEPVKWIPCRVGIYE